MGRTIRSFKDLSSYRILLERLDVGLYIQNSRGEIVDANAAFLSLFGAPSLEALLFARQDLLVQLQPLAKRLDMQKKGHVIRRVSVPHPETGEPVNYLETSFSEVDTEDGEVYYTGLLIPSDNERQYSERTENQNLRDPLTGVYNRHYFKVFETEVGEQRYGCILFYMDRLRRFSELFGEPAALEAISRMARFTLRFIRVHDPVVRMDDE